MERIDVKSHIITAVYYDQNDGKLMLLFKNGQQRLFADVPRTVVDRMIHAPSPGNFYIECIRSNFPRLAA